MYDKDPTVDAYIRGRLVTRNPMDMKAEDLFLTSANQSPLFSIKSGEYSSCLKQAAANVSSSSVPQKVSCEKMYTHHLDMRKHFDVTAIKPNGISLKAALNLDQKHSETWNQPMIKNPLRSKFTRISSVDVLDFNPDEFQKSVQMFTDAIKVTRDLNFNSQPLPFSVQCVQIPRETYNVLKKKRGKAKAVNVDVPHVARDLVEVPSKLVIGNTECCLMEICFGWVDAPCEKMKHCTDTFQFQFSDFPAELILFLEGLPILYAENANHQAKMLRDFLTELYGVFDLDIQVFDIGSLAIVCGARADKLDLFALSVLMTGRPFPADIDLMDQHWAKPYESLPDACKEYTCAKMHLLNLAYTTLMASLIRNLFPDPDAVLCVTEMSQKSFTVWFTEFVATTLIGIEPRAYVEELRTRAEMIRDLNPDRKLLDQLAKLMTDVPVVTHGGARYLHHARTWFIAQFAVLKDVKLDHYRGVLPNQSRSLTDLVLSDKLLYDREIVRDDSGLILRGEFGIIHNYQFGKTLYRLDYESLVHPIAQHKRPLRSSIEEWGRLNFQEIPTVFRILNLMSANDLSRFWVNNLRIYESLRSIYYHMKDELLGVSYLDFLVNKKKENAELHHQTVHENRVSQFGNAVGSQEILRAARALVDQDRRVCLLSSKSTQGTSSRVARHQQVLNVVPGINNERNRKLALKKKARVKRLMAERVNPPSRSAWLRGKQVRVLMDRAHELGEVPKQPSRQRQLPSKDLRHKVKDTSDPKPSEDTCSRPMSFKRYLREHPYEDVKVLLGKFSRR